MVVKAHTSTTVGEFPNRPELLYIKAALTMMPPLLSPPHITFHRIPSTPQNSIFDPSVHVLISMKSATYQLRFLLLVLS